VQRVKTILQINGHAAVVVPDNVLFEGGLDRPLIWIAMFTRYDSSR